jgi:hypothetical protein
MYQFGGLQCLTGRFPGCLVGGKPTQFVVNEIEQLFGCRWFTRLKAS